MEHEKQQYTLGGDVPEYESKGGVRDARKGSIMLGEAADLYGDIATAEEYGYVSRG
ncbi:hypothetical protein LTR60_005416, partial [Cryomyces antarcticus]